MPIVACKAVPYASMLTYAAAPRNMAFDWIRQQYDRVWIVSVTDAAIAPIFPTETGNIITLRFDDIDMDDPDGAKMLATGRYKPMSKQEAKKIVGFIRRAHGDPGNSLLLVNCMAGISRSGAIVTHAKDVCGISDDKFHAMNPRIIPNDYMLRLLSKA